jgi:exonuclease SbcC
VDDGSTVADLVRPVEAAIQRLTDLSFEQFRRTVLLAQGEFDAFLMADSRERGDLLEKITGTGIYAEISRRVHAGFITERDGHRQLQERLENSALLTDEQRAQLDTEKDQHATEVTAHQTQTKVLQTELHYRDDVRRKRESLRVARQEHRDAQAIFASAENDRRHLEKLDQVEPLRKLQERSTNLKAQIEIAEVTSNLAGDAYVAAEAAETSATRELVAATSAENVARQAHDAHVDTWREAELLDANIATTTQGLAASHETIVSAEMEAANAETSLRSVNTEVVNSQAGLTAIQTQLDDQISFAPLADRLTEILEGICVWGQLAEEAASLGVALSEADTARREAFQTEEASQKLLEEQEQKQQSLEEAIGDAEAILTQADESSLRYRDQKLRHVQEQLREAVAFARTAEDASESERRTDKLREQAARDLDIAREAHQRTLDGLAALQNEQYGVARSEMAISAHADRLRSELADGEACSVCGSTEHPYAHGGADALMAAAAEIRSRREELDLRIVASNAELQRLAGEIGSFEATRSAASLSLQECRKRYQAASEGFSGIRPRLIGSLAELHIESTFAVVLHSESEMELLSATELIAGLLTESTQILEGLERQGAVLTSLREQRKAVVTEIRTTQEGSAGLREAHERAKAAYHALELEVGNKQTSLRHQSASLIPSLQIVGLEASALDMDLPTVREVLEEAGQRVLAWRVERDRLTKCLVELEPLKARRDAQFVAAQQQLERVTASHNMLAKKLEEFAAQREFLLGGETTDVHRRRFEDAVRNAKSRCDLAQETERQAIAARHEQQRARDTADHDLKTLRREATEAEQSFATTCDTMNVEYAEANSLLGISTEAREELRGRLAAIETKLSDAANAEVIRGDDTRALAADSENVPEDRTADATLQAELQRLEENCSTLMQLIGGIDQQLQADDRGRSAAAELRQQLDTHTELLRAWAEIEEAIGSREGDRFRTFAQSITLEHLVQLANHHLQSISPRYQLSKGGDDKLALHIVDCEMDSERRSTRSLSGGERFLVSLALALALSGLNGRQSFVDTLFIDEGFGALDPDTLEIAVSALEIIQSLGRKVGIVTHVEGMKNRLPVQVRVEKMGGGRSRLRLFPE